MAEILRMPKLGFDMAEGTLVRWVKAEGEAVTKGVVLAEIETDKATVEVESSYDGQVARHLVGVGEVVPVNTPIAVIAAPGESVDYQALMGEEVGAASTAKPAPAEAAAAPTAEPVSVPGEAVAVQEAVEPLPGGIRASPLARRIAAEQGVDLRQVPGSGPAGRVTKRDLEAFMARPAPAVVVAPAVAKPAGTGVALPAVAVIGAAPASETIKLSRLRVAIGKRMAEAKQSAPHFYVTHTYDMADLMALRKQVNALLSEEEKVSVNDFIVKATALALREFPNLNASLDEAAGAVIRHGQVNIGVAVAVESGLLTVVCHDADRKPLRQIAVEVREKAGRAREGKVKPEDIEGSTFSVSNLGMFDVEHFIAILNPPEAAILAVGSVMEQAVVVNGEVKPGMRMKATISVDHRVSDGAEAARFLQALEKYLEHPLYALL